MKINKWTPEDIQFLIENLSENGSRYCAEKLNRTQVSVIYKAAKLKLKTRRYWSKEEKEWLKLNYYNGVDYCSNYLKRPRHKIIMMAHVLKVTCATDYAKILTKEFLEKEHTINKKSITQISKETGYAVPIIKRFLNIHNIEYISIVGLEKIGKKSSSWRGYEEMSGSYWDSVKRGARDRNLSFTITKEYVWNLFLKQERKCAFSGRLLKFKYDKYNWKDQTASLDRIDSNKGYEVGNVQWVHKHVNIMKNKLSDEEFIALCHEIAKFKTKS